MGSSKENMHCGFQSLSTCFFRKPSKHQFCTNVLPCLPKRQYVPSRVFSYQCRGETLGDPQARKYKVTIHNTHTGQVVTRYVPSDRYIWWSFMEQGIKLPSSCVNGCCTTCASKVVSGTVEQPLALGLLKEMKQRGYALLCVSYPRSDVELVLQDEDEVYLQQFGNTFESGGIEYGGLIPEED